MTDWSRGYAADSTYRVAYQTAQTPSHMAMVCALAGVRWQLRERLHVADLGCGRGYVANTLAAANPGWTVLGIDHSPAHLSEARQTAEAAALGNVRFVEADLGAIGDAALQRIEPLDVVMLHGLWSWVSDEVRSGIVRLLAQRLKPGGLVYVGYNALPGAASDFALQRLLRHLAGEAGGFAGAAEAAAQHAMQQLRGIANALPLPRTAMLQRLLADPPALEPAFVAHEFLTRHWRPVFHDDLCAELADAKLDFVGSSNLFEALPALFAEPDKLALLHAMTDAAAREFVKDLVLPRSFRADVFIRGARRTDPVAAVDALTVAASKALPSASPTLGTGAAQVALQQPVWDATRTALSAGPCSIGELRAAIGARAPHPAELLAVLVGTGHVLPVFRPVPATPTPSAMRFNRVAAALHAPGGEGEGHFALASPVAAGGVPAGAAELALAAALLEGADPGDAAALAASLQPDADTETHRRITDRISKLLGERLPVWRRFGVVV